MSSKSRWSLELNHTPAGAGGIGVVRKVLKYDILGNSTGGGGEISPSPEATAPVPFADLGKLPLDLERRTALHHAHPIADRPLRGHRDEHVHMIRRDHAAHDGDAVLLTDLNISYSVLHASRYVEGLSLTECTPSTAASSVSKLQIR